MFCVLLVDKLCKELHGYAVDGVDVICGVVFHISVFDDGGKFFCNGGGIFPGELKRPEAEVNFFELVRIAVASVKEVAFIIFCFAAGESLKLWRDTFVLRVPVQKAGNIYMGGRFHDARC